MESITYRKMLDCSSDLNMLDVLARESRSNPENHRVIQSVFDYRISREGFRFALEGERLIACSKANPARDLSYYLYGWYISPGFRGQGIEDELLSKQIEDARGCHTGMLELNEKVGPLYAKFLSQSSLLERLEPLPEYVITPYAYKILDSKSS